MRTTSSRPRLSALTAAALLVASPALADWSADVVTKTTLEPGKKSPPDLRGKVYGRQGLMRMDAELPAIAGGSMSILFDFEKRTGTTLVHSHKVATERSLDDLPVKLPTSCTSKTQSYDACFKEQGYQQVGTEQVNGHPSAVYEGTIPGATGVPTQQKIWRPTDLPEVPYVRARTTGPSGQVTEVNLSNIQQGKQPDSRFKVPAGYKKMAPPAAATGLPATVPAAFTAKDFEGKTPEQIQEMVRQRLGQQGIHAPQGTTSPSP